MAPCGPSTNRFPAWTAARRLVATAVDLFGGVDVVVSNAGGSPPAPAATASPRFHVRIIELNLIAPLHVAQAANEVMQAQPAGGSIIMIGSVSGIRPSRAPPPTARPRPACTTW
jgi:NAD(P)-dependent dehydrogenase (short-subunit alcohol dehydrogenase family)